MQFSEKIRGFTVQVGVSIIRKKSKKLIGTLLFLPAAQALNTRRDGDCGCMVRRKDTRFTSLAGRLMGHRTFPHVGLVLTTFNFAVIYIPGTLFSSLFNCCQQRQTAIIKQDARLPHPLRLPTDTPRRLPSTSSYIQLLRHCSHVYAHSTRGPSSF